MKHMSPSQRTTAFSVGQAGQASSSAELRKLNAGLYRLYASSGQVDNKQVDALAKDWHTLRKLARLHLVKMTMNRTVRMQGGFSNPSTLLA